VNFSTAAMPSTETAAATSAIYKLNVAATDPGVFTEGADGQGNAAVLNSATYATITQANPAGMHYTAANSDTVLLYVTGLGVPNSTAADTSGGGSTAPADCISPANYESALQTASGVSLTNIDGAILQASLIDPSRYAPCMATSSGNPTTIPAVTIGGVAATSVGYAGFVEGSVAGLYQINVKLPSTLGSFTSPGGTTLTNITGPVALPVVVTSQGGTSQTGVSIWVQPALKVTAPTALTGTVGIPWSGTNNSVTATDGNLATGGTGNYTYALALTSGPLPNGLTLTSAGAITGVPAANSGGSYIVTVTATDSSVVPVTGNVTFTVVVHADLFVSASPAGPFTGLVSALPIAGITTVSAAGGVAPYTYSIGSVTPPTGGAVGDITVDPAAGTVTVGASAIAGVYTVVINAVDSTTGTSLTGSITFTITLS
jgi:large repetitive protein